MRSCGILAGLELQTNGWINRYSLIDKNVLYVCLDKWLMVSSLCLRQRK